MGSSPLEGLESRQHIGSVKEPDVLRLRPRETAHGPREVHEVRLMWGAERMHTDFLGQQVPFAGVAARAGGEDVRPGVRAAAGEGHEMIARQTLTLPQLLLRAAAELAAVVVASKQECIGDLTAEAARDVHEANQANDGGPWDRHSLTVDRRSLGLDDLGLAIDQQAQRPAHPQQWQRLQ